MEAIIKIFGLSWLIGNILYFVWGTDWGKRDIEDIFFTIVTSIVTIGIATGYMGWYRLVIDEKASRWDVL